MKKLIIFIFLLVIVFAILAADDMAHNAVVIDNNGIKTESINLNFETRDPYSFRFAPTSDRFFVIAKPFQLAIPLSAIVSINIDGNNCDVVYKFDGKENKVSGGFLPGTFKGDTDFGTFRVGLKNVSKVIFKKLPSDTTVSDLNAAIILRNGDKIQVGDVKIYDAFSNLRQTYRKLTKKTGRHIANLEFYIGDTFLTVPFINIKKIEFKAKTKNINVTLKNGKKMTGQLLMDAKGSIDGFTGVYSEGEFYIDAGFIKTVEFNGE